MRPFEYLFLRQMKFDYISPPICEALFSSTGEPTILLETFERDKIQGLELEVSGGVTIRWSAYPGALCYSVYQADGPEGPWVVIAECIENNEFTPPDPDLCYAVTVITPEGESDISDPICPSTISCPEWLTAPSGAENVTCGNTLNLAAQALVSGAPASILYEWVKDGDLVFAETTNGSSNYSKVIVSTDDSGLYLVTATYEGCYVTANIVITAFCGGGGCEDLGEAAPEGAEAFRIPLYAGDDPVNPLQPIPIEWESFSLACGAGTELLPPAAPGSYRIVIPGDVDHPPGRYGLRYIDGFIIHTVAVFPPPNPYYFEVLVNALEDLEHFALTGSPWSDALAFQWQIEQPLPPHAVLGQGWTIAGPDFTGGTLATVQAYFTGLFNAPLATWSFTFQGFDHSNTGGPFTAVFSYDILNDVNGITLRVMQYDGLIQQPRGVRVTDWVSVKTLFDVSVQTWDGNLPNRTDYDLTVCQWDASGFTATVFYTQALGLLSPNGCGWLVEITGSGGYLWRGMKVHGDTGEGTYVIAGESSFGPECIQIEEIPVTPP